MNEPGLYLHSENPEPIDWSARGTSDSALSSEQLLHRIDADCFICRRPLTVGDPKALDLATREDVFPRWLWRRLQLAIGGAGINLLAGNWKNYPGLVVPCCRECNNHYMSQVETRIAEGIRSFAAFEKLSRSDLSLWAAKILYGLLHFEVKPWDPKTKSQLPSRLDASAFDHLQLSIRLLNGFRKRIILDTPKWPFSILRFHLKSGGPRSLNFQFRDSVNWPVALAMRVDSVGFVVVFDDFGYSEDWYDRVLRRLLDGRQIHPLQFSEIVARTFYEAGMVQSNIEYWSRESPAGMILTLRPEMVASLPPDSRRRAAMISEYTGLPLTELWSKEREDTVSLLVRKNGKFQDIPFEKNVVYPM
jgi:hypothetical protein